MATRLTPVRRRPRRQPGSSQSRAGARGARRCGARGSPCECWRRSSTSSAERRRPCSPPPGSTSPARTGPRSWRARRPPIPSSNGTSSANSRAARCARSCRYATLIHSRLQRLGARAAAPSRVAGDEGAGRGQRRRRARQERGRADGARRVHRARPRAGNRVVGLMTMPPRAELRRGQPALVRRVARAGRRCAVCASCRWGRRRTTPSLRPRARRSCASARGCCADRKRPIGDAKCRRNAPTP